MNENSKQSQQEKVEQIYAYAAELKKNGLSNPDIQQKLEEKGLDKEIAVAVVSNLNKASNKSLRPQEEDEGSGAGRWLIYILILVGVNVLSAVFDWGFWIY